MFCRAKHPSIVNSSLLIVNLRSAAKLSYLTWLPVGNSPGILTAKLPNADTWRYWEKKAVPSDDITTGGLM
jgi:hypothetical protein